LSGIFSKDARPSIAGTYVDFVASQAAAVLPSIGSTVCVGFTHNWGPVKTPTLLTSWSQFLDTFKGDPSNPTSGYKAVLQAFEGDDDMGGAGAVLAYRMSGSTSAAATHQLQNTTPANALTLTAKYAGTLGNGLSITVQDNASDNTKDELLIYSGTTLLETYVYTDTDIVGLAAEINSLSNWVTATELVTGVKLAYVTNASLTGGNDGTTLVSGDYTTAMNDLATQRFGVLVFENLTDPSITASLLAWLQSQNDAGYRFFIVTGGPLGEDNATALARADALDNPNALTIGQGTLTDQTLLDSLGNPTVLSPAQFAPSVAGSLAARGERYSLTYAKFSRITLTNGATAAEIAKAKAGGLLVLDRFSDTVATVRIANGVTTYQDTNNAAKPLAIYGVPKFVATMQGLQNDLQVWADENVIGKTTVDNDTRTAVLAQLNDMLRLREQLGSVQPGWSAYVDPSPPPSDSDDFVAFVIVAKFGRSTEQVYFTAMVS
jgi:hypothetical protein